MVEPESLDPGVVTGVPEHRILSNLFEGLTTTDPKDLSPRPGMAASWTLSKDGLTYTFNLRDATWTDGRPVTAQDFVFAWERVLNPKSGAKYAQHLFYLRNGEAYNTGRLTDFGQVGVRAVDPKTLQVTLKSPTAYFLDLTNFYTLYPLRGGPWRRTARLGETGEDGQQRPFMLASWVPQKSWCSKRIPDTGMRAREASAGDLPSHGRRQHGLQAVLAGDSDWIRRFRPRRSTPQRPTRVLRVPVSRDLLLPAQRYEAAGQRRARAQGTQPGRRPRGAYQVRDQGRRGAYSGFVPAGLRGYEGPRGSASTRPPRESCSPRPAIRTGRASPGWSSCTTRAISIG